MTPDHTYGVLLLSFSRHSHQRNFVPVFQRHPRVRIVAVADEPGIEPALRTVNRRWAQELDVPYIESVDRALARADVDVVSIGHEIERRADLAVRAAAAGKHLWIDKFIGATIEECDAVVNAVERAGVASIIPSYIYSDWVARCRQVIDSGALGALMGIHADVMFSKGRPREIRPAHRSSTRMLPPGRWKFPDIKRELLTEGAYAMGLIQWCIGRITRVCAWGGAYFFPEHAAYGADDFGAMTMTDEDGRVATLSGSRIGTGTHPYGGPMNAYLIGTRGTARIDGKRPAVDVYLRERVIRADYAPPPDDPMQWASRAPVTGVGLSDDPLWAGLTDLIDALDTGRMPRYTVREARDLMEVMIAGYHAMVSGETVQLPLSREKTP